MSVFWELVAVYSPSVVLGALFLVSFHREPRQFRNAIWLLLFVMTLSATLLMRFAQEWMVLPLLVVVALTPLTVIVFLSVNALVVIRHEGVSLATLLPALLALALSAYLVFYPVLFVLHAPRWLLGVGALIVCEGLWFFFTFAALLLYSWFYRILPRKRRYDYIIVHGAGLNADRPTPLLKGRLDKAVQLWNRQGRRGTIIVSGGQGADEVVSEAQAMRDYLVKDLGIARDSIMMEDRSTTTYENLRNCKRIIDARSVAAPGSAPASGSGGAQPYRAALVTSDYHVLRACEYAHRLGLRADGIGSHTASYYWPAAFIREFIAISRAHMWPYYAIAIIWVLAQLPALAGMHR